MSAAVENIDYKALYEQQLPLLKSQQESNLQLQNQVTQLQYQLHQLTKLLGGFKSEHFVPSGAQAQQELGLAFEKAFAATNLSDVQKISYVKTKQAPRENGLQNPFPEHLRVEEQVIEPDEEVSHCEKDGEEIKEQLGWKPGEIFIKRTICPCYKCPVAGQPGKHRILVAAQPPQALPKSTQQHYRLKQN